MPNPSLSIEKIIANNLPVLCFDTCSLLDIIRDPTRKDATSLTGKHAKELLNLSNNDTLAFVTVEQVTQELSDHADTIQNEALSKIKRLLKQIDDIQKINKIYNPHIPTLDLEYWTRQPQKARELFDKIINASFVPETPDAIHKKATLRVTRAHAPSSQAKDSLKDCLIIESIFDFTEQLRQSDHSNKICFTSSNKADFCAKTSNGIHPDLEKDFNKYALEFTVNLGHAANLFKS